METNNQKKTSKEINYLKIKIKITIIIIIIINYKVKFILLAIKKNKGFHL